MAGGVRELEVSSSTRAGWANAGLPCKSHSLVSPAGFPCWLANAACAHCAGWQDTGSVLHVAPLRWCPCVSLHHAHTHNPTLRRLAGHGQRAARGTSALVPLCELAPRTHTHTPPLCAGWQDTGSVLRVQASSALQPDVMSVFEAEQLVLAPGEWAPDCLGMFGLDMDVEVGRQQTSVCVCVHMCTHMCLHVRMCTCS